MAALRADGTTVRFQHVRAHAGHGMNERADRLAARGAQGMRCRGGVIYVPTDGARQAGPRGRRLRSAQRAVRPPGRFGSGLRAGGGVGREGGKGGKDAWLRW